MNTISRSKLLLNASLHGLITGLLLLLYSAFTMGPEIAQGKSNKFSYVIVITGMIVGTLINKKANNGYLSFKRAYVTALFIAIISGLISVIGIIISMKLHPESLQDVVALAEEQLQEKNLSEAEMEKAMGMVKSMFSPVGIGLMMFFGYFILGAFASLITAAIFKKEPPLFDNPQ